MPVEWQSEIIAMKVFPNNNDVISTAAIYFHRFHLVLNYLQPQMLRRSQKIDAALLFLIYK